MIENRVGDLLKQTDLDGFSHCCNCFCLFSAGIAKLIKETYPEAYQADLKTIKGDINKLGSYSFAITSNNLIIYNHYAQFSFGRDKCQLDYDAFKNGLILIKEDLIKRFGNNKLIKLGVPYKIGCMNAGGDWNTVLTILNELFKEDKNILLIICKLKEIDEEEKLRHNLMNVYRRFKTDDGN